MKTNPSMKAVIYHGPHDLRLETVPSPSCGEEDIIVKIGAALTCGTDLKAYRRGHPVLLNHQCPSPFGHEFSGTIVEKGKKITSFKIGDRVVCANSGPCDRCDACKDNLPNLCENMRLLNGAYAEFIRVPSHIVRHNTYRLQNHTSFAHAAFSEPLACVVRAVDRCKIKAGQKVLVYGAGLMGMLFTKLCTLSDAEVVAIGRSHEKLEKCKSMGAKTVLSILDFENPQALSQSILAESNHSRGFDVVIEAIGLPETWENTLDWVKPGGKVLFYGGCAPGATFPLDTHKLHYQEISLIGCFHHTPQHFKKALDLIEQQKIPMNLLLNENPDSILSLDEVPRYFSKQAERPFEKHIIQG